MRTTLDLPDDLYALVKARAALEGRTVRSVMEELLKGWVESGPGPARDSNRLNAVAESRVGYGNRIGARASTKSGHEIPAPKEEAEAPATTDAPDALESHRVHLRNLMRHPKSLDELGELLTGPEADMDMSTMRELYQRKLAEEWKRRHP